MPRSAAFGEWIAADTVIEVSNQRRHDHACGEAIAQGNDLAGAKLPTKKDMAERGAAGRDHRPTLRR